jgi:hypothetical protein
VALETWLELVLADRPRTFYGGKGLFAPGDSIDLIPLWHVVRRDLLRTTATHRGP